MTSARAHHELNDPVGRLDILDYLGMLGLTLVSSDAATLVYQDRMVTYGMDPAASDEGSLTYPFTSGA